MGPTTSSLTASTTCPLVNSATRLFNLADKELEITENIRNHTLSHLQDPRAHANKPQESIEACLGLLSVALIGLKNALSIDGALTFKDHALVAARNIFETAEGADHILRSKAAARIKELSGHIVQALQGRSDRCRRQTNRADKLHRELEGITTYR